jgi:hypothetical protein
MMQLHTDSYDNGYYQVGNKMYANKMQALYDATKTKQDVSWHFNDETYKKIDWSIPPTESLLELYRQRAQQIRDEYDYIVLSFSGGADSHNILQTFLKNNIKLDEIYTKFPLRAERKWVEANTQDLDEQNVDSEWEFAARPMLEYVEKHHPDIKISFDDSSDSYEQSIIPESRFQADTANHYQAIRTYTTWNRTTDSIEKQMHLNKRIAFVQGHDKIQVTKVDGKYHAHFVDRAAEETIPGRHNEWFYWTKKFPLLPVAQAHHVMNLFKALDNFKNNPDKKLKHYKILQRILKQRISNIHLPQHLMYREFYRDACYPHWDNNTFQAGKVLGPMVVKSEYWVKKHNPQLYDSWVWGTKQWMNNIDHKYLRIIDNTIVGAEIMHSCLYSLE